MNHQNSTDAINGVRGVRQRLGRTGHINFGKESYLADQSDKIVRFPRNPVPKTISYHVLFVVFSIYAALFAVQIFLERYHYPEPLMHDDIPSHPDEFIAERAMNRLIKLTKISPRVAGSYENEVLAVGMLKQEINKIIREADPVHTIELDVQKYSGSFPLRFLDGLTNVYENVQDVIVKLNSRDSSPHSLLMNCHFDSVPDSPGGSDDGAGCAVLLEILDVLSKSDVRPEHNIIFLFNGAEENLMHGSHGFITQHRWAKEVRAFVNLEACGAGGREVLFQSGPNSPWIMEVYAKSVLYPFASSMAQEVFESGLIPGDTDFRVFRDFGKISGLDFAWSTNGYVYHTKYDDVDQIPLGALQRTGENMLALAKGLANAEEMKDVAKYREGNMIYFDLLGFYLVRWSEHVGKMLNISTVILSVVLLYVSVMDAKVKDIKPKTYLRYLIRTFGVVLLGAGCSLFVVICISCFLSLTGKSMSWYGQPLWLLFLYIIPSTVAVMVVQHYFAEKFLRVELSSEFLGLLRRVFCGRRISNLGIGRFTSFTIHWHLHRVLKRIYERTLERMNEKEGINDRADKMMSGRFHSINNSGQPLKMSMDGKTGETSDFIYKIRRPQRTRRNNPRNSDDNSSSKCHEASILGKFQVLSPYFFVKCRKFYCFQVIQSRMVLFQMYFDVHQACWTSILLASVILKIRSGYIAWMWVFGPCMGILIHRLFRSPLLRGPDWKWLLFLLVSMSLPVIQHINMQVGCLALFIPIMGRSGASLNSEIVIALFTNVTFGMLFAHVSPLIILMKNSKKILSGLSGLFLVAFLLQLFTPLGFPYSGNYQSPRPQRFMILHTERAFFNRPGNEVGSESGYWIVDHDYNSPDTVKPYVPEVSHAKLIDKDCEKHLYCGLPYLMPVLSFIKKTHWIPSHPPKIEKPTSLTVLSREVVGDGERITLEIKGPDHMGLIISPKTNVDFVRWSLNNDGPVKGPKWNGQETYFVYFASSSDPESWIVSFDFKVSAYNKTLMDLALTSHFLHGPRKTQLSFKRMLAQFPSWTAVTSWTATYKSFVL